MYIDELIFRNKCEEYGFKHMRNGYPDNLVFKIDKKFVYMAGVEIKGKKGKLSKSQQKFKGFCLINKLPYYVITPDNVNEFFTNVFHKIAIKRDKTPFDDYFEYDKLTVPEALTTIIREVKKIKNRYTNE